MGETICFKDPAFINQITKWTKKNITGLKIVEEVSSGVVSVNLNTPVGSPKSV
jgi:hypothetical protein